MTTTTRIYPSGDFTAGQTFVKPKREKSLDTDYSLKRDAYWKGWRWEYFSIIECIPGNKIRRAVRDKGRRQAQRKRGSLGISARGRRMLRSAATLLERDEGIKTLSFLTCTLPSVSQEKLQILCNNWSEIVRKFCQELRRLLLASGLPADYCHCIEIQEGRMATKGEPCPHIHLLFKGRSSRYRNWAITKTEFRELWNRILSHYIGSDFDGRASTRVEAIRSSTIGYMSKYLSKGGKALARIKEEFGENWLPSCWYGMNKNLRDKINRETRTLTGFESDYFVDNIPELGNLTFISYRPIIFVANEGTPHEQKRTMGYCGQILCRTLLASLQSK